MPLNRTASFIWTRSKACTKLIALLTTILLAMAQQASAQTKPLEAKVSNATTEFGLGLIRTVLKDSTDNVILSPVSLQSALSMVLLGTGDNSTSSKELAAVLGYDKYFPGATSNSTSSSADRLQTHDALRSIFQSIRDALAAPVAQTNTTEGAKNETLNFTIANAVLSNKNAVKLNKLYEQELKTYYESQVQEFEWNQNKSSFVVGGNEKLEEHVNKWVATKTNQQISDLVAEGDLTDQNLVSVILNAAHFKGRWLRPFEQRNTDDLLFYNNGLPKGENTKFMRQTGNFKYADLCESSLLKEFNRLQEGNQNVTSIEEVEMSENERKQLELAKKLDSYALEMAFSVRNGDEFSMVILLPAQRDGLGRLLYELNVERLAQVYELMDELKVEVELPKFTFEAKYEADVLLKKMGLRSLFDESADLSRMFEIANGGTKSKLDKVIHKAKVMVDESGAEAAAVSMGTVMLRNFVRTRVPRFIADHPFLFVIKHSKSHLPLFMGCVNKF